MASPQEASDNSLDDKATQHVQGPPTNSDVEKQQQQERLAQKKSVYAGLGWLDRLLVLWILLAIIIGILLGNFVDSVGPALQKGKFINVSVPIGMIVFLRYHLDVRMLIGFEQLLVSWS